MPPASTRRSALTITSRGDDFGMKPSAPRSSALHDIVAIVKARKNDERDGGIAFAQFGQKRQAVTIGQAEIEQDEAKIGMLLDEPRRLPAIRASSTIAPSTNSLARRAAPRGPGHGHQPPGSSFRKPRATAGGCPSMVHCNCEGRSGSNVRVSLPCWRRSVYPH